MRPQGNTGPSLSRRAQVDVVPKKADSRYLECGRFRRWPQRRSYSSFVLPSISGTTSGPPSVRAMVSILQKDFAEEATLREDVTENADDLTLTVPDAKLWTAAHSARRQKASARIARVLIEAAIRRALLRLDGPSSANAIVIAPDDLSRE